MALTLPRFSSLAVVLLVLALPWTAAATFWTPTVVNLHFRGMLTTPEGTVVDDPSVNITVRIYVEAEGDLPPIYEETHEGVYVNKGNFDLPIGSLSPLDSALFAQDLFLGIEVNGDGEATPRLPIYPVTNAFQAENTGRLGGLPATEYLTIDDVGSIAGPEGPVGSTGETGPEGPIGPEGPPGPSVDVANFATAGEVAALEAQLIALEQIVDDLAALVGSGGTIDPDAVLYGEVHTGAECTEAGGIVTDITDGEKLCRFLQSSCPGDWTALEDWCTTTTYYCVAAVGGNSSVCPPAKICTVAGHPFANTPSSSCCAANQCGYEYSEGTQECQGPDWCGLPPNTCCSTPVVEIGCY